jgi:Ca2+-binding RTX toxin-like protein
MPAHSIWNGYPSIITTTITANTTSNEQGRSIMKTIALPTQVRGSIMRIFLSILGVAFFSTTAQAAVVTGTNGNDTLFFQGVLGPVSTTLTNPYDGTTFTINDTYNNNTATYDGLGGTDTLLLTNVADLLLPETGGVQTIVNMENIVAGNGADVIDVASTSFTLGNIFINGGSADDLIWSGSGNDTLQGVDGNDILDGGPGDDSLAGGNGNDILYGGTGSDTAVYSGNLSSYTITRTGPDQFDVQGFTYLDHLTGIEFAQFSDQTIDLSTVVVPVPAAVWLFGSGLIGLIGVARRKAA